jgi:hypothetical protein
MLSETDDTSAIVYTYDSAGLVTRVAESSVLTPTVVYAYAYLWPLHRFSFQLRFGTHRRMVHVQ